MHDGSGLGYLNCSLYKSRDLALTTTLCSRVGASPSSFLSPQSLIRRSSVLLQLRDPHWIMNLIIYIDIINIDNFI